MRFDQKSKENILAAAVRSSLTTATCTRRALPVFLPTGGALF